MECIKSWITSNHNWELTIFSDEKRFSLDGPDDWRSYVQYSPSNYRMKRQYKGGSVMNDDNAKRSAVVQGGERKYEFRWVHKIAVREYCAHNKVKLRRKLVLPRR